MIYEYWKTTLGAQEKQLYNDLYAAFSSGKDSVSVRSFEIEQIKQVYLSVKSDHPELFYISSAPRLCQRSPFEYVLMLEKTYSKIELLQRNKALTAAVAQLKSRLSPNASDFEKEFSVTEYIVDKVQYAVDNAKNQDASSVIYAGKAQCSGVANAVKYLLDNLGVKCITVTGAARTGNMPVAHSWNIVYIDQKPYHIDVTSIIGSNQRGTKPYRFTCFNLSDKQIAATHSWDQKQLPTCGFSFVSPETAKMSATAKIMPVGSAYANSDDAVIIPSLYEFRRRFLIELDKPHNEFVFLSEIKCEDDNELMKILSQACRQCFTQKKKQYPIRISISANMVVLAW